MRLGSNPRILFCNVEEGEGRERSGVEWTLAGICYVGPANKIIVSWGVS
jgi:hypothetical protein